LKPLQDPEIPPEFVDYNTSSVFVTPGVCAIDKTYDVYLVHSFTFSFKQV